ncbi:hypothetical protein TVAG_390930 [Trichomonas vaginalis G3]|uniref:Uncharacterized protein n=1 Tax=Trichomonas vaginalis (strain ATCC PRA-98 / G3) TaxID=412133 RepID=A2DFK7_TRIV3|nr:hypothetical protein TVAG_390930 [Trichomonas vaginalis G3]|eukprot:XP_001581696.1 hypothetical protein [Trichomonas vaginalis G3]
MILKIISANFYSQCPTTFLLSTNQVENTQQAVGSGNDPSLEEIIARLIASLDISLYATMKPAFKSFLESFAKWLKNKVNREQGINFTIPDIEFTRRGVREALITLGKTDSSRGLKFCEEFRIFSISLDCGTHSSRHGLFSCVCNPGKTDRHQFFDTTISTNWTYEDYHTWFDSLKVNKNHVAGVVGDGLPAQVKGLCHWRPEGALFPGLQTVYIRCLNHVLNNAIVHARKQCPLLNELMNRVHQIIIIFKNHDMRARYKIRVPSIPETRWLYIYDTLFFIFDNLETINTALRSGDLPLSLSRATREQLQWTCDGIPPLFKDALMIFKPLKQLQLWLKSNKAMGAYAFLMIQQCQGMLDEMAGRLTPDGEEIHRSITTIFKNDMKEYGRIDLLRFAFGFTPLARKIIRDKKGFGGKTSYPPIMQLKDVQVPTIPSLRIINREITFEKLGEILEEERTERVDEVAEHDEEIQQAEEEQMLNDDHAAETNADDSRNSLVWDVVDEEIKDLYTFMITILRQRAIAESTVDPTINKDDRAKELSDAYDFFIEQDDSHLINGHHLAQNDGKFWYMNGIKQLKAIRPIGKRMMSLSCSEADVERVISELRKTKNSMNESCKEEYVACRFFIKLNDDQFDI